MIVCNHHHTITLLRSKEKRRIFISLVKFFLCLGDKEEHDVKTFFLYSNEMSLKYFTAAVSLLLGTVISNEKDHTHRALYFYILKSELIPQE